MPVPLEVLRDALVREIDTQRATDDYEVEIFNRDLPLFVVTGTKPELVVRNLVLDNRSNRFDASVSLAGSNAAPVVVNGRLEPMLDVPVLRIHAMPGDLIGEADVQWIRIEARRADRKSVVEGKSVSVRVNLGGRRCIKKNKRHTYNIRRTRN